MDVRDPYVAIDDVLMPWAKAHGFKVGTQHRDDIVRSIWFYDQIGKDVARRAGYSQCSYGFCRRV